MNNQPDNASKIGWLIGGGLFLVTITMPLPLIISLIIYLKKKTFPVNTFIVVGYGMLTILTIYLVLGHN